MPTGSLQARTEAASPACRVFCAEDGQWVAVLQAYGIRGVRRGVAAEP